MAHVRLSEIIDIITTQYNEEPDSYVYGTSRTLIISHAKRILQELSYAGMRSVRLYVTEVSSTGKISLPDDYVEYVKIYYCVGNYLIPAFYNGNINQQQWEGLKEFEEEIIYTATGKRIYTESGKYLTISKRSNDHVKDYGETPGTCFLKGYKYDDKNNCFVFDYIPDGVTHIAVEYVADPLVSEPDPDKLGVHKYFQKAVEAGVYFRLVEQKRNVPMNEKLRAKKEWNSKYRDAVNELNAKPWEYVQMIMGWKHMYHKSYNGFGNQSSSQIPKNDKKCVIEYQYYVCQLNEGVNTGKKIATRILFKEAYRAHKEKLYLIGKYKDNDFRHLTPVQLAILPDLEYEQCLKDTEKYIIDNNMTEGANLVFRNDPIINDSDMCPVSHSNL